MNRRLNVTSTFEEIKEHRASLAQYWGNIPEEWVNLDCYLDAGSEDEDLEDEDWRWVKNDYTDLVVHLQGTRAPSNECGAVGCLLGWCWTYKPYQDWCQRRDYALTSKGALNEYLGLPASHRFYEGRLDYGRPHKEEVMGRFAEILRADIHIE